MKTIFFQSHRSFLSLICVFTLILIQLPVISPIYGFDRNSASPAKVSKFAASPSAVFSNTAPISITDRASSSSPNGISSPYPSNIAVSGLSGTLNNITVTLNNVTLPRTRDIDVVLVAPNGTAFMLLSDTGEGSTGPTNNADITLSDAAAAFLPTTGGIATGTYKPTDIVSSLAGNDDFPAPGPASISRPAPTGSATFASVYNGINPNGTWSLYAEDDALGGGSSMIAGGWSLDITTAGAAAATTTTISSSVNPSLTTQSVTFTAAVTSAGNPVTAGTVSFTQNGTAIAGCTNVNVNGSGQAICTASAGTLPEGRLTITANYNGTASFGASSASLTQTVNSPTVVNGSQFCNNGGININDNGTAVQYPSNITVSNLVGTISKVTVNLNNLNLPRVTDIDLLLVAPGGQSFVILSDVGDINPANGVNLTLDDAAAGNVPTGSAISSGTFKPTDRDVPGAPDNFPAPAPGTFSTPAPNGSATFASVYNGTNPNGNWSLYAVDDSLGGGASTIGSYCLNFTVAKFTTSTSLSSSNNPSQQSQPVTFTATVTTTGTGTPSGTVEFFDGATSLGTDTLNASGQATLTTSTLPNGTRNITAQYLGADIGAGGGGYVGSTSGVLQQVVLVPTAANVGISGRILSPNGRGIAKAVVTLTDDNGSIKYSITNPFGYFRFTDVRVGAVHILNVKAKNIQFVPQVITVNQEINNLNLTVQ